MQKPNTLKVTLLTSALFCIIKLALDIFFIMYNHLSLYTALFGEPLKSEPLPTNIKFGLMLEAVIVSAPICILASINCAYKDLKRKRGIITLIIAILMFLLDYVGAFLVNSLLCNNIREKYGENIITIVKQVNSLRDFSGFLVCAAFVMVCCCASIEIYGGSLKEKGAQG
ncbi:hypothetical protein SAMN04487860_11082 [Ruminococcus flavefaciens]|uniref:Uncharacterized protein n=2 Tax=Ruminococcus flavefaciens TaxID=1265 RepID=A0A1M7KW53_RUMFL|nr:hypothetical protein SAMN04487860_11082 [Ruminococcus flavefaciens]